MPSQHQGDQSKSLPKLNMSISVSDSRLGEQFEAKLISRAGKAKGKHTSWFNVEVTGADNLAGERPSLDFDDLECWSEISGSADHGLISCTRDATRDEFSEAKVGEIKSWVENDVFEEVPLQDIRQKILDTQWILTTKADIPESPTHRERIPG